MILLPCASTWKLCGKNSPKRDTCHWKCNLIWVTYFLCSRKYLSSLNWKIFVVKLSMLFSILFRIEIMFLKMKLQCKKENKLFWSLEVKWKKAEKRLQWKVMSLVGCKGWLLYPMPQTESGGCLDWLGIGRVDSVCISGAAGLALATHLALSNFLIIVSILVGFTTQFGHWVLSRQSLPTLNNIFT